MMRKLVPVLIAAAVAAGPSAAAPTQERIIRELEAQGFTRIQIHQTWLGRTRILATSQDARREIVLNPSSGVILRDYWFDLDDDDDDRTSIVGSRDDNDDDDDDDNSGSGSSGSDDSDDDDDDGGSDSGGDDSDDDDDDD